MLHITNGDSAAVGIRETALGGEVLSWIDVLHEGPVPSDLGLGELRRVRAEFITSCGWTDFDEALGLFSRRDQVLADSLGQEEVVLWFEHDLYDQLQLIQILDWFAHQELSRTKLSMICAAEYLGPSTVERLRQRYPEREPVSHAQLDLAKAAWAAFRTVVEFLKSHPGALDEVRFVLYTRENEAAYAIFSGALEGIISAT